MFSGAGGTGTAAIKIGRTLGTHVIAAAASEEKRAFALTRGADQVIDYTAND